MIEQKVLRILTFFFLGFTSIAIILVWIVMLISDSEPMDKLIWSGVFLAILGILAYLVKFILQRFYILDHGLDAIITVIGFELSKPRLKTRKNDRLAVDRKIRYVVDMRAQIKIEIPEKYSESVLHLETIETDDSAQLSNGRKFKAKVHPKKFSKYVVFWWEPINEP